MAEQIVRLVWRQGVCSTRCCLHNQVHKDARRERRPVSGNLGQPEYRRVRDDLRRKIAAGELQVGEAIPSTSKLQQEYSVSSTVVRRAVNDLRGEGLLYGQSGKAVFVRAMPEAAKNEQATLELIAERFDSLERRVDEMEAGDKDLARTLRQDLRETKALVAVLQAHLIELYGRTGQPYPHTLSSGSQQDEINSGRAAGA